MNFFQSFKTQIKKYSKFFKIIWLILFFTVVLGALFFVLVDNGLLGTMPSVEELASHENSHATEIFSEDGVVLGRYYSENQNRVHIDFNRLPKHLIDALIATEDIRFFSHSGIDLRGLGRAIIGMVSGGNSGGGSTITQQLAKNLFPRKRHSSKLEIVFQKFKEWVIAVKLERNYTKNEIITYYLNTFDFLYQGVGIKSAANIYFNKEPANLDLLESATLVGMAKNPSLFNPNRFPKKSKHRRNVVLYQMVKYDYLSKSTFDSIKNMPIKLDFRVQDHLSGAGTYFREFIRLTISAKKPDKNNYASWAHQKYIEDSIEWETNPFYGWCNKNKKSNGKPYNIYSDGLKIYSTINSTLQGYAEEAVKFHLGTDLQPLFEKLKKYKRKPPFSNDIPKKMVDDIMERAMKQTDRYKALEEQGKNEEDIIASFHQKVNMKIFTWSGIKDTIMTPYDSLLYYKGFLRAGFMAMEPSSGKVKAYVGGPDFKYFMYDMVTSGRRQVGSAIKPFLYTVAMQEGYTPCDEVLNVPQTIALPSGDVWTPKSSNTKDAGKKITLKKALATSNNWISAWLVNQYGPNAVVQSARRLGVRSPIEAVYSNVLGSAEIYLHEMAAAFSVFANKGVYTKPIYVNRIEDKDGNVLARFIPETREVMSVKDAYLMIKLLKGVTSGGGTGVRLRYRYNLMHPVAGKTGTSQNHSDGWFIALTPDLVAATWVGAENRDVHFDNLLYGQGAYMALPIYAKFMQNVYADEKLNFSTRDFDKPFGFSKNLFDCNEPRQQDDANEEDPKTDEINEAEDLM